MKTVLMLAIVATTLFACSKSNDGDNGVIPDPIYVGTYTSTGKDTVRVSKNGDYVKFTYRSYESIHTPIPAPTTPINLGVQEAQYNRIFDSVRVATNLSFTDNEIYTSYTYYTGSIFPLPTSSSFTDSNTGAGLFGTNTVSIQFDALTFNGVKL